MSLNKENESLATKLGIASIPAFVLVSLSVAYNQYKFSSLEKRIINSTIDTEAREKIVHIANGSREIWLNNQSILSYIVKMENKIVELEKRIVSLEEDKKKKKVKTVRIVKQKDPIDEIVEDYNREKSIFTSEIGNLEPLSE